MIWDKQSWNRTQLHMVPVSHLHLLSFFQMHFFFFPGDGRPGVIRSPFRSFVKVHFHEIIGCVCPTLTHSLSLLLHRPSLPNAADAGEQLPQPLGAASLFHSLRGDQATDIVLNLKLLLIITWARLTFGFFHLKSPHKTVQKQIQPIEVNYLMPSSATDLPSCHYYANKMAKKGDIYVFPYWNVGAFSKYGGLLDASLRNDNLSERKTDFFTCSRTCNRSC